MDRVWLMAIVIGVAVLLLALMVVGWRTRQWRQRDIPAPPTVPADRGTPVGSFPGTYVATSSAADPLDRIAVHGLGYRSAVVAQVGPTGTLLERTGEPDVWIPHAAVTGAGRATWTIDRAVEPGGLSVIEWTLGERTLATALRLADPDAFLATIQPFITAANERTLP